MPKRNSSDKKDNAKRPRTWYPKSFLDPIHGHIELNPFLVKVIDTPQFQRLRKIKQLSLCYYVYPGASHNRFEHCIGTCHLAGKLVRHLANNLPEKDWKITKKEIFCVELAGLCHDLGHGPFSHLFDEIIRKDRDTNEKWEHEMGSIKMLQYLFDQNKLIEIFNENEAFKKEFEEEFKDEDLEFVKEMIYGPLQENNNIYKRGEEKKFLYEIVSNKKSGVDVDKFDYLARDCHHLGIKSSFIHNRYIALTKVLKEENGETCIAVRDKELFNLYEMFHTRYALHKKACKHKTVVAINEMISDILALADKSIKFNGDEGEKTISQTIDDMSTFQLLNDSVLDLIIRAEGDSTNLKTAQNLLKRLSDRNIYRFIGHYSFPGTKQNRNDLKIEYIKVKSQADEAKKKLEELAKKQNLDKDLLVKVLEFGYGMESFNPDDLTDYGIESFNPIDLTDYGMESFNPVDRTIFYSKEKPTEIKKISRVEVSHMLPEIFLEYQLFVYCKSEEYEVEENVKKCFNEWKKEEEKKEEEKKEKERKNREEREKI